MSAEKKLTVLERLQHARRVSVPLVGVNTADPQATMVSIANLCNGGPVIVWDSIRGVWPLNEAGKPVAAKFKQGGEDVTIRNLPFFLAMVPDAAPPRTLAFILNSDQYLCGEKLDRDVLQGVWNIRDQFKLDVRMLVLLAPNLKLPPALHDDVVVLDEELPDAEQLDKIVREMDEAASVCTACRGTGASKGIKCDGCGGSGKNPRKPLADDTVKVAVEATLGLSAFAAEQAVAMALRPAVKNHPTIDLSHLWDTKRSLINQVQGLTVESAGFTFADCGGLEHVRDFASALFSGPYPPSLVVQLAEVEKAMAGAEGDLSGTSQDQLGVLLESMENEGWGGMVAFGPPGTGKSLVTKAMANSFGRMSIVLDLGACKGSLVGQSEQQVRAAVKTIKAIGGSKVFFVATANKLSIKPELLRRFRYGVWFFDLPTAAEREAIWVLQRKAWGINPKDATPDSEGWTGSDIRNVCELAHSTGLSLSSVLKFANSNSKASPEVIRAAREAADGRFLSASYEGTYSIPATSRQRQLAV